MKQRLMLTLDLSIASAAFCRAQQNDNIASVSVADGYGSDTA